jgi:spermidine synthase
MGTRHILLMMGGILVLTALGWGALFRTRRTAVVVLLLPSFLIIGFYDLGFKPSLSADTSYYKESDYYTIKIKQVKSSDGKTGLKTLVLDNLVHSYVNMEDPLHVEYRYEKIYSDVLSWNFTKDSPFRSLTIGAGGYTFPRYMEALYPKARVDVVEIDPEVTRVARDHLGLPKDTRIRTWNEDGRWFVMNCKDKYDVIFIDAYNDLSLPYHLTTREFGSMLREIMNPEAILLTNIIDNLQKGAFLPSYVRTLREVFGEENVHVISISPEFGKMRTATFIVMAGKGKLDIGDFERHMKNSGTATSTVVPLEMLNDLLAKNYSVVLTDDYAPVDNLIAPVFEARFGYNRRER